MRAVASSRRRSASRQGPELHPRLVQVLDHLQPVGKPRESRSMWVITGVSPGGHQVQQFQQAAAVVLGPAGFLGPDISHGATGADQALHL